MYNHTYDIVLLLLLLLLLFLTFIVLAANPKNLLYTVANPARGLLNRGKTKKKSGSVPQAGLNVVFLPCDRGLDFMHQLM